MKSMIHRRKAAIATSLVVIAWGRRFGNGNVAGPQARLRDTLPESSLHSEIIEAKALGDGCRHLRIETHMGIFHFRMQDASKRVDQSQSASFGERQPHRKRYDRIGRHLGI